jgi:hypothetical protein
MVFATASGVVTERAFGVVLSDRLRGILEPFECCER